MTKFDTNNRLIRRSDVSQYCNPALYFTLKEL